MYFSVLVFFGLIVFFWVFHGVPVAYGTARLPWLKNFSPLPDSECPRISLLFAARDEEEKLPTALATLETIDYPNLEIIAVNDRSQDATGRILDEFASTHQQFRVLHISELPANWLGKPHALQKAYEASHGDWLLFTDADVRFKPDTVRRAMTLAKQRKLDHLTLFGDVEMVGFWETVLLTFFGLAFHIGANSYRVANPHSRAYAGMGAFQLLRRSAYEDCGTHRRLAMEVLDDMKLGKIIKQAGFHSEVGIAQDFVAVRWHSGLGNLIHGVTKNFFASMGYSLPTASMVVLGILSMNVAPFLGLFLGHGWIRGLSAIAVLIALWFHAGVAWAMRTSWLYAFTHPLGAVLLAYMLLRSTIVTLRQGGIVWRDTFYPLDKLKRGVV